MYLRSLRNGHYYRYASSKEWIYEKIVGPYEGRDGTTVCRVRKVLGCHQGKWNLFLYDSPEERPQNSFVVPVEINITIGE